jgi:hypothetical protein
MAIAFACPGCATPFDITAQMAGKRAKCPKCNIVFTLPSAAPTAVKTSPPPVPPPVTDLFQKKSSPADERRRTSPGPREDDRDDSIDSVRRRGRGKRGKTSATPWVFAIVGVVLVLFLLCAGSVMVLLFIRLDSQEAKGRVAANEKPADPPAPQPPVGQPPPQFIPPGGPPGGQPPGGQPPGGQPPPFPPPPIGPPGNPGAKLPELQRVAKRVNLAKGAFMTDAILDVTATRDPFRPGNYACHVYQVDLQQGRTYVVDMQKNDQQLDPYLHLVDANGRLLLSDDDSGGDLNARMRFTPATTGTYYVLATTFDSSGRGPYRLTIRDERGGP